MRVLRLDLDEGPLDLHPFVTVVRGCSPAEREELLAALADIPRGTARVGGLVESHGVLFDLVDENLALLDLAADLDIVVSPRDLPNADSLDSSSVAAAERQLAETRAQLSAAEAHLVAALASRDEAWDALEAVEREVEQLSATDEVAETVAVAAGDQGDEPGAVPDRPLGRDDRAAIESAVARASVVQVRARGALEDAETALEAARAEQRTVAERLVDAQRALDGSSTRRDPAAEAAAEAARQRLAEAERVLEAAGRGEAPAEVVAGDIDELRRERARIEAAILAVDTPDPLPVRLALEGFEPQRSEMVESPAAVSLAERWAIAEHDHQVAADAVGAAAADRSAVAIRQRIRDAEAAVASAQQQLRGPSNDPEDVKELERAHDEIADAREAAEKRFGAAKAGQRLEEAQAAEAAVLARLGYDSWADYRLGIPSAPAQDTEILGQQLAEAQRELAEALAADQAADADIASELQFAEVVERRRAIRAEAVELLGHDPGDDLEGALRRHRVPAADSGTDAHLDRLRGALAGVGVELGDEHLDEAVLRSLAEVWLLEQTAAVSQRGELEQALADAESRLASLEGSASSAAGDPIAAAEAAVESARSALDAAEARLASDSEVGAELADARDVLADLHVREREIADRVALCDEQVQVVAAMLRAAVDEVQRGEAQLTALARDAETSASVAAARAARQTSVLQAAGDVEALGLAVDEALDAVDVARQVYVEAGISVGAATAHLRHVSESVDAARRRREDDAAGASAEESQAAAAAAAEDIEWFLLARLAAQRSASFAGSVPLVLDDALAGMDPAGARSILGRLERMATTVQLIVLSEELATSSWAENLGDERALVVQR